MNGMLFPDLEQTTPETGADVAYTPYEVVEAILRSGVLPPPRGAVWEPFAGAGSWVRALRAAGAQVSATELDGAAASVREGLAVRGDALRGSPACLPEDYEVWTNPPFSLAGEALEVWRRSPRPPRRVVFLVLQSWIVAESRVWVWRHLRAQIVLSPRLSFEGPGRCGGTDMREYALVDLRLDRVVRRRMVGRLNWRTGEAIVDE